jgi:DNA-binding MarR family transcriptional regulator
MAVRAPAHASSLPAGELPRISYLIYRLERALRRELDDCVAGTGVSPTQYLALSIMDIRNGLSNAQLARLCSVTPQSMSDVILALESKGLIRRAPDSANRRILRTVLTTEGRRVLASCDTAVHEMEETIFGWLGDDRERLRNELSSCLQVTSKRRRPV